MPKSKKSSAVVTEDKDQKLQAATAAIEQIRDRFGESAIMKYGEAPKMKVEVVSTGSLTLDMALGVGGVPRGRVVEIYGPEASGKTTLALQIIAEAQKGNGAAAFVDAEHALDPDYAKKIGVDTKNLLISQPDTGEQALEIVETLVRSNALDVVVIDSVAALTPKAEIEGDMGDSHMGLQARLMSQALRKLTAAVSKSKTIVIFINQIRMKIGVMFGNPETTPGGNALKFYSSVRIEVRRRAQLKKGEDVVGTRVKSKVVKNKVAPPFQVAEFDLMHDEGISRSGEILDWAEKYDVLQKSGTWYTYDGDKLGQGRESARKFLKKNPKIMKDMEKKVRQAIKEEAAEEEK